MTTAGPRGPRQLMSACCLILGLATISCTHQDSPSWRVGDDSLPNIMLVVIDTLRADHLGMYGYSRPTSPNLDAFADEAAVFQRSFSHSPWTMPSIASILTGLVPRDHGITQWEQPLAPRFLTLTERLQQAGYRTGACVSHHILKPRYHYDQGFQSYDFSVLKLGSSRKVSSSPHIARCGTDFLDQDSDAPFFLWLHFFDPHNDYVKHEGHDFGDQPMDRYDSEIAFTDQYLGQVFDFLDASGLSDSTIVVVMADHGEEFRDHGGTKHTLTLYNEVIRIPLVMKVPGFSGTRMEQLVAETQVSPTILALAGLPVPDSFSAPIIPFDADGFSAGGDHTIIAETLREADKRAVVQDRWKFILDKKKHRRYLFDLSKDPSEKHNLAGREPATTSRLLSLVEKHYAGGRTQIQAQPLAPETKEALEALGYVTGDAPSGN